MGELPFSEGRPVQLPGPGGPRPQDLRLGPRHAPALLLRAGGGGGGGNKQVEEEEEDDEEEDSDEEESDDDDDDEDEDEDAISNRILKTSNMSVSLMKALGMDVSDKEVKTDWKPPTHAGMTNSKRLV